MNTSVVLWTCAGLLAPGDADWLEELSAPAHESARVPDWIVAADGTPGATWIEAGAEGPRLVLAALEEDGLGEPRAVVAAPELFVNWADFPRAARAEDGGTLVAWLARRPAGGYAYDVVLRWRAGRAQDWGEPLSLSSDSSDVEHGFVSLAPLGGSRLAALWLDGRAMPAGAPMSLYSALVEAGEVRAEQRVDERVCDCCQTALVQLADGSLLAAYRDRGPGETRDISVVRGRVGADGALAWSAPRPLSEDGWVIAGCPVNGPALTSEHGRAAAAWFTLGAELEPRVMVAGLDPQTGRFGTPRRVDDGAPEGRVALATLPGGRLFVSWMERRGERAEWRLRELPRAGELPDARVVAEVPLTRDSGFLRLASAGADLLAAWTDEGVRFARLRPTEDER